MRSKGRAGKSKSLKYARQARANYAKALAKHGITLMEPDISPRLKQAIRGKAKIEALIERGIKINRAPNFMRRVTAGIKEAIHGA